MDWAFASSVPMAELLTTPGLPHPKDDTEPSLTAAFRAGVTNHLEREESKIVLPAVWEGHEKGVAFLGPQTLQGAVRISFRENKQLIYLQISVNSTRKLPFQIWQNYLKRMISHQALMAVDRECGGMLNSPRDFPLNQLNTTLDKAQERLL